MVRWVIGSIPHGGLIRLFLLPAKVCDILSVSGMVHINDSLLQIENSPCSGVSSILHFAI